MKIGLIDVDSHNFPNLCLMKLSEYHTRRGDRVEWWSPKGRYDLVYKSRVFTDTYSKDTIVVNNAEKVIQGGTGYGPGGKDLPYEIEHIRPDYFLYPRFLGTAYGFLSRGCPRNCGFCIVSGKEGRRSVKVADLSEFWRGEDEIKLLDPNLLACPDHEALLEQLAASRALVDFTQPGTGHPADEPGQHRPAEQGADQGGAFRLGQPGGGPDGALPALCGAYCHPKRPEPAGVCTDQLRQHP